MNNISNMQRLKDISSVHHQGKKELIFFKDMADKLYMLCSLEEKLNDEYFKIKTFEELLNQNHDIYKDLIGDEYKTSYGNPDYAADMLGDDLGKCATYLYSKLFNVIDLIYNHKTEYVDKLLGLFIVSYEYVTKKEFTPEGLVEVIKEYEEEILLYQIEEKIKNLAVYTKCNNRTIVEEANEDLRYLFKYGKYITDNEIVMAKFLNKYDGVDKIAYTMVKGYMDSFERENKDYKIKSTVKVIYFVGQEAIVKQVIKEFAKYGLDVILTTVEGTPVNKQFSYDHRFDLALYFDDKVADVNLKSYKTIFEKYKKELRLRSGGAYFESFGEEPFAPESKSTSLKLDEKQSEVYQGMTLKLRKIQDEYMPSVENTFTIIAFPTPEIGDRFEEIYEATMKINTLDSDKWERIQNTIIEALDKGEYVHVKGCNGNKTDIMVKMHELQNPEKETNFENCIATVNIPVGEVFTSPTLKGTNGLLHVEEVFLDGLKYIDLKLTFKDGYIDRYSCKNFIDEEKNKKYIEENLLFPNKTLPIGEFAIGTNTLAYVIAQKYDIVSILPILIGEKMGPHFAVGDTCYSYSEDNRVYNQFDGKEIVAKDNEKSILRKEDPTKAYTQCHTDITIPYDSLAFINAITKDGKEIEIIKNGRFILKGTEELNEFFNEDI